MEAIGVYDSGVGGLTVLKELRKNFPKEKFVYFADTAHLPYGTKSLDQIQSYAKGAGDFFENLGVKALVIACNTATGAALDLLKDQMSCPVLGVIGPGAKAAYQVSKIGKYGLLATQATVDQGFYEKQLKGLDPGAKIYSQGCPQLVLAVEDGLGSHYIGKKIAWEYLDLLPVDYDTLILGCTHFPLARQGVEDYFAFYKRKVTVVDPAEQICLDLKETIQIKNQAKPGVTYYCSGDPKAFRQKAEKILGKKIRVKRVKE